MSISLSSFGKSTSDKEADLITITNKMGSKLVLTNFGAHIVSIIVPDMYGSFADVCLGFDDLKGYDGENNAYIGGTVGRYCNRVKNATVSINGVDYPCSKNEGNNMLHGGFSGFDKKLWDYKIFEDGNKVEMHYLSSDMEEGFPGNLDVKVSFSFNDKNEVRIDYKATCDKDTAVNLTNHSYFNLLASGDVMDHLFYINADYISELDDEKIPTGWLAEVGNTPFDLRQKRSLRSCLGARLEHPMFDNANGFDASFVLEGEGLREVASATELNSGRRMRVITDMPAMQFYSGQLLSVSGKGGKIYQPYSGFAFETQFPPDSINQSEEGDSLLKAGDVFESTTIYAFDTIDSMP